MIVKNGLIHTQQQPLARLINNIENYTPLNFKLSRVCFYTLER